MDNQETAAQVVVIWLRAKSVLIVMLLSVAHIGLACIHARESG